MKVLSIIRLGSGIAIHSTNSSTLLVTRSLPPGVEILRDAKAGDVIEEANFIAHLVYSLHPVETSTAVTHLKRKRTV